MPKGYAVLVSIALIHDDDAVFPDARSFDPSRFVGARPGHSTWIPFGGGIRRCIGAAFANMEMNVTLRTVLRDEFEFGTPYAAGERVCTRAAWPLRRAQGGRAVVYRRRADARPTTLTAAARG